MPGEPSDPDDDARMLQRLARIEQPSADDPGLWVGEAGDRHAAVLADFAHFRDTEGLVDPVKSADLAGKILL